MNLAMRTVSFAQDRRDWLGSEHGTDAPRSITLDVTKFTAGTHFPDGFLKSGLPLGKITTTGLYGLYDGSASDGRETCVGLLFTGVEIVDHRGRSATKVGGSMLLHGFIRTDKLPVAIDTAGLTDLASRIYTV
jgi:hypothetical protein